MTRTFAPHIPNDSGLYRLHPLTKLVLCGALLVLGLSLPGIWPTYAAFILLIVPLAAWGGFAGRYLRTILALVLPFAISLVLVQGLFWQNGTILLALGPLSFKVEGIEFAAASTGRIAMVLGSFLMLTYSTPADALMLALTERGLPGSIAYIVLTTIQIAPRFQARAQQIIDAQHARGLETEGSLLRRIRALLPMVVPLVLGSIVDVEERAIALEARAFSRQGPKTSLLVLTDTRLQVIARRLILFAALAVMVLRIVPGGLH